MDPNSTSILLSSPNHFSSITTFPHSHPCNDDHPSYSKMICSTIRALNEKDGSSVKAIKKYMEQEYKDCILPNHDTLLAQNLKYLKENNILIMVKKSYKLSTTSSDKPMSYSLSSSSFVPMAHDFSSKLNPDSKLAPQLEQNVELQSTHPRLNDKGKFSSSVGGATTGVSKVDQDCSLKVSSEREVVNSMLRLENGKRVRRPPMRYQAFMTVDVISKGHKRRPGRPPKAHVKPLPPPNAIGLTQLSANSIPIGSPKPRGRPKKNVVASPSIAGGGKKPVVAMKPMKKSIRKPTGSPKVSTIAEEKEEDIEAELRRKYYFMQPKVKRCVQTLRSYFHRKSPLVTRVAIHKLQTLASLEFEDLICLGKDAWLPPLFIRKPNNGELRQRYYR